MQLKQKLTTECFKSVLFLIVFLRHEGICLLCSWFQLNQLKPANSAKVSEDLPKLLPW